MTARKPSMLGPEQVAPPSTCRYCGRALKHVPHANRWRRVACLREECQRRRALETNLAKVARYRARLQAALPQAVIYERACNACGKGYRGPNRLLCRSCWKKRW